MFSLFQSCRNQIFCVLAVLFICNGIIFAEEATVPQQVLDLQQAASQSLAEGDMAGALESYQAIIQAFPGTEYAMDAQAEIIEVHIENDALPVATTETTRMLSTYSGLTEDIDDALNLVIRACNRKGHSQQAIEHCQYMLAHWPNSNRAMWGVSRQAQARIMLGELVEAERLIESLKSGYSDQKYFGAVLCLDIADNYIAKGHPDKALRLWQDVSSEFPADPTSKRRLASYYLKQGDLPKASLYINQLKQNCSPDEAAGCLMSLANAYKKEYPDFCVDLYEQIVSAWPDWSRSAEAQKRLVDALIRSGNTAADAELERLMAQYGDAENIVSLLRHIIWVYQRQGSPAKCLELNALILRQYPDDPLAMRTQRDQIRLAVRMNDTATAEAGLETLFTRYTEPEGAFLVMVSEVLDAYRKINDDSLVIEIGNRVLRGNPTHENTAWIYHDLARSYLGLNAREQADAAVDAIVEKYSEHPKFTYMINGIADRYRSNQHYAKAVELYQLALDEATNNKEKLNAYAGMAKGQIQGSEMLTDPNSTAGSVVACPSVDTIVGILVSTYKDEKKTGYHVFQIGEEYYFRSERALKDKDTAKANADFQKAVAIWQKNINQIDDPFHQAMAAYYSAVACQYTGRHEDVIKYYQQVVDTQSDFEKAWYAQYMIAKHYEKQAAQGKTSTEQVRQAYQTLLDKYPDSSAAKIASKKLNTL